MRDRPDCKARRINDQMVCGACALQWDIDDDDAPSCIKVESSQKDHLAEIRNILQSDVKQKGK